VTTENFGANYHGYLTYLKAPATAGSGTGCYDSLCLWVVANDVESNATVDVRARASGELLRSYTGAEIARSTSGAHTKLTLRLATNSEVVHLRSDGLEVYVVNPNAQKWSAPGPIDPIH
jgi:hypothetical protein